MTFKELLSNSFNGATLTNLDPKSIVLYPVSESNLEGIKILIDTSMRMGINDNNNVTIATISPSLWMGDVLDKHWQKISYVCSMPVFEIIKIEGSNIVAKSYRVGEVIFKTDEEMDTFFNMGIWKKFVIFSMVKYADLVNMTTYYKVRYADITEKFEERDAKITEILKD